MLLVKYLTSNQDWEKYKDPIVYKTFINYASDECLVQVFDIPLVNRFLNFIQYRDS